ncbi:hypothetical protein M9H77_16890 [Catharanthus roseus]|uniref:Uncharacterized protein n=1 Tax=Catharanthus roseus TaxID=4058 RepID=A0ACC0B318_CATRO|nr:hypothetical protein M9H77_16890 [Catharanthus roseus]
MIIVSVMFIILQRQKLGDTFSHDELYRKLQTYRDDHERAGQLVDHCSDEFWVINTSVEFYKAFCILKARKAEEHRQNSARAATGTLFPVAPFDHRMEDIARRRRIDYANYILHKIVAALLNMIGISMSELGPLKSPPDCQMPGYPSSEGTSYTRPIGEGDDQEVRMTAIFS